MKRNAKIALVVIAIVLLAVIAFVLIRPENPMQKALESCEKTATIGTYTITSFVTTQISGTNTTTSFTTVTTQQQICTVSP